MPENGGITKTLAIDLANAHSVGGGWRNGAIAQEEDLFLRSNLSSSLEHKNIVVAGNYGRLKYKESIGDDQALYCKGITVFKDETYRVLAPEQRFTTDVMAIAGYHLGPKGGILNDQCNHRTDNEKKLFAAYKNDLENGKLKNIADKNNDFVNLKRYLLN